MRLLTKLELDKLIRRKYLLLGGCRRRNQKLAAVVEDALIEFGVEVFDDLFHWN